MRPCRILHGGMDISFTTVRLFIHVLAATVWVGGQIVMVGLVPLARSISADAPRLLARRFGLLSWPALAILTFTGIWNVLAIDIREYPSAYRVKFGLKMTCYLITALGAVLHTAGPSVGRRYRRVRVPFLAVGGAASGLGAVGALFFAVALTY